MMKLLFIMMQEILHETIIIRHHKKLYFKTTNVHKDLITFNKS